MQSLHEIVRRAEENYRGGTVKIGDHVNWSMHETIETITAYLNSKHISGPKDALGRAKPFFNIVTAATNIWYRATDIDRKDIRFVPKKQSSIVLAFIANVILQNWMDRNRFGQFLNQWGRTLAQYGSSIVEFVDRGDDLIPSVIPWSRAVVDPVDFSSLPHIKKIYKTEGQLQNMATEGHPDYAGYSLDAVEALCTAVSKRKNISGEDIDNQSEFIEIYEVHGILPISVYKQAKGIHIDETDHKKFRQQMHAISYVKSQTTQGYDDFTLYCGYEKQDPQMITHLIEEDGRTLSIGAVEHLFDAQWMQNHSMKVWKDTMDLSSKLIFQTADPYFVGRNVLSAIEGGDIMVHEENKPLTQLNNSKQDITQIQGFQNQWRMLAQEITSTPDAIRGNTLPSGTPYSLGAFLGENANSLFEIMTENKGLAIEDMMRKYVVPFIRRHLKGNKDEIVAILDDAGITEIDAMYVPREAVRRFNKRAISQVMSSLEDPSAPLPSPYSPEMRAQEESGVRQSLAPLGNKRFFKPSDLDSDDWDKVFAAFEWDSIRVEVTNESVDKKAILTTLAAVLQTIATNPAALQTEAGRTIFNQILSETGRISPMQISNISASQASGGSAGALKALQDTANTES